MNGGHYQFFENNGIGYAREVFKSLHGVGLIEFADILDGGLRIASTRKWQVISSVDEFVEGSAEGLFDRQDNAFYSLSPDLLELLQAMALCQKNEFFTIVP